MRPSLLVLLCLTVVVAGCANRSTNRWTGSKAEGSFAVVFAPVDTTAIDPLWKDASNQFAYDLANRVDILGKDADGWASETLPRSGDPAWAAPATVAGGADWVVLTRLLSVEPGPSPFGPQLVAKVEMRAFDAHGKEVFRRTTHGTASTEVPPKLVSPENQPPVVAAWNACTNANSALIEALRLRNDRFIEPAAPVQPVEPSEPVVITVTSVPDHADVLINGKFRGTTPLALTLAPTAVTVRIERQGYQPWTRELTPAAAMQVSPALEPLLSAPQAPAAPATEGAAPATETAPQP